MRKYSGCHLLFSQTGPWSYCRQQKYALPTGKSVHFVSFRLWCCAFQEQELRRPPVSVEFSRNHLPPNHSYPKPVSMRRLLSLLYNAALQLLTSKFKNVSQKLKCQKLKYLWEMSRSHKKLLGLPVIVYIKIKLSCGMETQVVQLGW